MPGGYRLGAEEVEVGVARGAGVDEDHPGEPRDQPESDDQREIGQVTSADARAVSARRQTETMPIPAICSICKMQVDGDGATQEYADRAAGRRVAPPLARARAADAQPEALFLALPGARGQALARAAARAHAPGRDRRAADQRARRRAQSRREHGYAPRRQARGGRACRAAALFDRPALDDRGDHRCRARDRRAAPTSTSAPCWPRCCRHARPARAGRIRASDGQGGRGAAPANGRGRRTR